MKSIRTHADAKVSVSFRSARQMKAVAEALGPEASRPAGEKGRVKILMRGKVLQLQFQAKDSSSLRAITSSYIRMLGAMVNVSNSLRDLERKSEPN